MTVKQKKDNAGKNTHETRQTKEKNSRRGLWTVLACVALGIVAGIFAGIALIRIPPAAEMVFAVEDLRITLTENFAAFENDRFAGVLVSEDVGVTVLKEPFSQVPGSESLSLEEYGHLVIANNGITGTMLCTDDGLTYFEFKRENREVDQVFCYFAAVYKTEDAFWLVQMGVLDEEYRNFRDTLETWARSVTFE